MPADPLELAAKVVEEMGPELAGCAVEGLLRIVRKRASGGGWGHMRRREKGQRRNAQAA
jgi:hypothetical protein